MKIAITAALAAVVTLAVVWPHFFGVAGVYGPAQVVALRGLTITFGLALVAILAVLAVTWRRARPYILTVAAVVMAGAIFSASIMAVRGMGDDQPHTTDQDTVTVLSYNIYLDKVPASDIATMVTDHDVDVAVLIESTEQTAREVAERTGGKFQMLYVPAEGDHLGTGLLIAHDLGPYRTAHVAGAELVAFTAHPSQPGSPPITTVHSFPPIQGGMDHWKRDNTWAIDHCKSTKGVILAGDFNATVDHPMMRNLEPCVDAASARKAAAIGTWPTKLPRWMGAQIDHIIADSRVWEVEAFTVLDSHSGSDHRPVLATVHKKS